MFGHIISEQDREGAFNITSFEHDYTEKQGTVCQLVRFTSDISQKLHCKIFVQLGIIRCRWQLINKYSVIYLIMFG